MYLMKIFCLGGYAYIDWKHPIKPKILELAWEAENDSYFGKHNLKNKNE